MFTIDTIFIGLCWLCAGSMAGLLWRGKHLGLLLNIGVGAVGWYLTRLLMGARWTIAYDVTDFLIEGVIYSTIGSWMLLMMISLFLRITVSRYQMD